MLVVHQSDLNGLSRLTTCLPLNWYLLLLLSYYGWRWWGWKKCCLNACEKFQTFFSRHGFRVNHHCKSIISRGWYSGRLPPWKIISFDHFVWTYSYFCHFSLMKGKMWFDLGKPVTLCKISNLSYWYHIYPLFRTFYLIRLWYWYQKLLMFKGCQI